MVDQWISIQEGTFKNWCNEQLKVGGRSVSDMNADFCDGVNLVALVEALQFRKIGKVFTKPTSKIQQLQNVSLALTAIMEDNVKLVNVGGDDIVNGNAKIIMGLIWTLVQRYQISGRKTKAPPKKLMLAWFRAVVPELDISNFTNDWNNGIILHALLEHLKPGTSPDWQKLNRNNGVENCRRAMVLAKDALNIPRVIQPEDFASPALDELSSMTYLSYFVKFESPGYYHTLNWACKQLRTTNITNLTTDWNDGYYLCGIVHSLGGQIPGWPNLDRTKKLENCQAGIDAVKAMGIEVPLTAKEMTDINVDHLSIMSLVSRLSTVKPHKSAAEKLELRYNFASVKVGTRVEFQVVIADAGVETGKVTITLTGPSGDVSCDVKWTSKAAICSFTSTDVGEHKLRVNYQGVEIRGCPVEFVVKGDRSKCRLLTTSGRTVMGETFEVEVDPGGSWREEVVMESTSPTGELRYLTTERKGDVSVGTIQPREIGDWRIHVYLGDEEIQGSPVQLKVSDPNKAWMSGPENGFVGDVIMLNVHCKGTGGGQVSGSVTRYGSDVTFDLSQDPEHADVYILSFTVEEKGVYQVSAKLDDKDIRGSPARIITIDPGEITLTGEGLLTGIKGDKCSFSVDMGHVGGNITVEVMDGTERLDVDMRHPSLEVYEFTYVPPRAGNYSINLYLDGRLLPGSPFHPRITDKSRVFLMDDLSDLKDENDHLALECGKETILNYNIADAGPGQFSAEILSPDGRLPVEIRNQDQDTVQVGFTAKVEGDHYIHLYWSNVALDQSPILAYCPGPVLPVNHALVVITGDGHQTARATVYAEFMIDGRKAGPGIPRVRMRGVKTDVDVEMQAMKYDRYKCRYAAPYPGGYLLQVEWSGMEIPGSPFKVNVTNKGHSDKVKVEGAGLKGGYVGQELRAVVDTTLAGNGEITTDCFGLRHNARCDQIDHRDGKFTLRIFPTEACRHTLEVRYDGEHVPGSPFHIPVGEPPDPRNVRVYGPGIEPGVIQTFESKFIVETYGAGAGQLAVRIRGPRGAFKVEMKRDREDERTILCRYDPEEPGEYVVTIKWSGVHVPGSPFTVPVFASMEALYKHAKETKHIELIADYQWKEEI